MKSTLSLLTALLLLTACHTRKVSIVKSDSSNLQKMQIAKDSTVSRIDTSKIIHTGTALSYNTGASTIVETGKFDNGKLDSGTRTIVKTHKAKKVNTSSLIASTGKSYFGTATLTTLQSDSTAVKKSSKQTDSTSDNKWVWGLGIIAVGAIALSVRKFKENK